MAQRTTSKAWMMTRGCGGGCSSKTVESAPCGCESEQLWWRTCVVWAWRGVAWHGLQGALGDKTMRPALVVFPPESTVSILSALPARQPLNASLPTGVSALEPLNASARLRHAKSHLAAPLVPHPPSFRPLHSHPTHPTPLPHSSTERIGLNHVDCLQITDA